MQAGRALTLARLALAGVAALGLVWLTASENGTAVTHSVTRDQLELVPRPAVADPGVTLVAVPRWDGNAPAPRAEPGGERRVLARAVDRLTALGARTIVVAPVLEHPDEDPAADAALEDALRRSGRCVLGEETPYSWWLDVERVAGPLARFRAAARGAGIVTPAIDYDGVPRRVMLEAPLAGARHPHAALVLAELAGDDGSGAALPRDRYDMVLFDDAAVGPIPRVDLSALLADPGETFRPRIAGRVVVLGQVEPTAIVYYPPTARIGARSTGWISSEEFTARTIACLRRGAVLVDLGPRLALWPLGALFALALLTGRFGVAGTLALLAFAFAFAWGAAVLLVRRGELFDALAVSRGLLLIAVVRLADIWLSRHARVQRLSALLADRTRRALDSTRVPEDSVAKLDAALLAELLPARYVDPVPIGEGGMGVICRVRDTERGCTVALKLLAPSAHLGPRALERFFAEMKLGQSLQHPGLVRMLDAGEGAVPFFTMELLDGRSLARRLAEDGPLAPLSALLLVREIAEVLVFLHGRGVVHRDLKPANVMVLADGTIKLLDLGVARHDAGSGLTATGDVVGTMAYMPPEQLTGAVATPACDVYSAGVLLAECIIGAVPARDGVIHVVPRDQLASRGGSAALADLVARLLDPRPSARPADGAALLAALDLVAPTLDGG